MELPSTIVDLGIFSSDDSRDVRKDHSASASNCPAKPRYPAV